MSRHLTAARHPCAVAVCKRHRIRRRMNPAVGGGGTGTHHMTRHHMNLQLNQLNWQAPRSHNPSVPRLRTISAIRA